MFKEDNIKWAISLVVSILALVIPIVLTIVQEDNKELTYQIVSESTIVNLSDSVFQEIEVRYKGQPVKKLNVTTAKIINSGDLPIRPAEYDSPLTINFDQEAELLRAIVVEKVPKYLQIEIIEEKKGVQIKPTLLNVGDSFTLQLMSKGNYDRIDLSARIADISVITESSITSSNKALSGDLSKLLQLPPSFLIYIALTISLVIYIMGYFAGTKLTLTKVVICCIASTIFGLLVFPFVFKLQSLFAAITNFNIATVLAAIIWILFTTGMAVNLYEMMMVAAYEADKR